MDTNFETREADGKKYIDGYFAVFGGRYQLWDKAEETIDEGAFHLDRDTDVRALVNHDTTLVIGRTTAGTLNLFVDQIGLGGSIEINEADQDAVNAWERVKRRDVTQCSFGFEILDEEMVVRDDGVTVWHLKDVKLYEVSICTFPAYEDTAVQARKNEVENIAKRKREAWVSAMQKRLKGERDA
jgi:HK97 family phage prohead protease